MRMNYFFLDRYLTLLPAPSNNEWDLKEDTMKKIVQIIEANAQPTDTLLEIDGELEFLANSENSIIDDYKDDFSGLMTYFEDLKNELIKYLIKKKMFENLCIFDLDSLEMNTNNIEDTILLNLNKNNYKSMKKICGLSRSLQNIKMICDIVGVFSNFKVSLPLTTLADKSTLQTLLEKAFCNIIDGNLVQGSVYYLNVAYSLNLSAPSSLMRLLDKLMFDL